MYQAGTEGPNTSCRRLYVRRYITNVHQGSVACWSASGSRPASEIWSPVPSSCRFLFVACCSLLLLFVCCLLFVVCCLLLDVGAKDFAMKLFARAIILSTGNVMTKHPHATLKMFPASRLN